MKILSFTSVYPTPDEPSRGIFIRNRLRALANEAEVTVLAPVALIEYGRPTKKIRGRVPPSRQDGNLEVLYPRWLPLPFGGALNVVTLCLQSFKTVLRQEASGIEVIDAHFGHPEGAAAALLAWAIGRPFTVTIRGSEVIHARYHFRRWAMKWAFRRAACVISVSERLRQFAISLGVDPERAVTIPNGVDTSVFHLRDRDQMRLRLNVPANQKMILAAGHLVPEKGHHRVVQALASLRDRGCRAGLVIAGTAGPGGRGYKAEMQIMATGLNVQDQITWLGQTDHRALAEYMCAADVFCLASSREGWPNVLHEALACGTPAVCTDVGAVPELIGSPRNGIVVPAEDQERLVQALQQALLQDWDRPSISAHGSARTWEHVGHEVIRQFEKLIPHGLRNAQEPVSVIPEP
jgi:glycosyltransferase involved in cell wall biosynthesis